MIKTIKSAVDAKHGNAVLYGALIGLVLSDLIPTPADAVYFSIEKKLRDKWKRGELTPRQYWVRETLAYYSLNPLWWAIIAGITMNVKGDTNTKLKVGMALLGSTAVVGVILKNISKDKLESSLSHPEEIITMPDKEFKVSELKNRLEDFYNYTIIEQKKNKS